MKLFSKKHPAGRQPQQHPVLYILLSFFIPFLVTTLAVVALRVIPFGDKHSLAITDAKWYLNGLMSFARLVRGEENLLYSLGNGLGMNQWSSLSWGSFAPANLLALFATLETMPAWFTWVCALNISLCGLTMYIMLAGLRGPKSSHLIFSTSYAMMGFTVVNCYQIGFFQGVQVLPLMILGLAKLLRGQRPWLYILSLAVCIFTNFYFGFSLCVASVVFLAAYVYVNRDALRGVIKSRLFTYAFSSLIAGLLAAPMWLPALKAFSGGGRLDQTKLAEYTFRENMPFIRMFSKLFTGANSQNELVIGMPNIFCGILVLALVILYFMDKGVEIRRKRAAAIVLGFYLLSFYIPAFTLLMHGGTHTNWFPYRYSFVFSFFMICIAAEEFRHLDALSMQDCRRCGAVLLVAALIVFSTSYEFISGACVVLDLALLFLMWVGFWLYKTRPERAPYRVLCLYLLILVCANQYANFIITTKHVQDWELDLEEYRKNTFVSGVLTEAVRNAEDGFFRMEKDHSESESVGADPQLYNYNGVSHSGPAERMFVHKQLNRLGINWFDMRHWYSEGIPAATDALLGLKYLISERDLAEEKGYEYRIEMEDKKLYQSHVFLSPAILANDACADLELGANVFDNLNQVWKSMTSLDKDIFTIQKDISFTAQHAIADLSVNSSELVDFFEQPEEGQGEEKSQRASIVFSFVATADGPVYRFDTSIPESDGGLVEPAIKYCGFYHAGDTVTGKMTVYNADYVTDDLLRGYCANLAFAIADNAVLAEHAGLLNARDITFKADHEDDLTGAFTADKNQRILFTIPWDEGWTCYIDGQPVPIDKTWDLFMSVEAPEGHHTYEMKFIPAWLNYGLYIGGGALLALIVFMVVWRIRRKKTAVIPQQSQEGAVAA